MLKADGLIQDIPLVKLRWRWLKEGSYSPCYPFCILSLGDVSFGCYDCEQGVGKIVVDFFKSMLTSTEVCLQWNGILLLTYDSIEEWSQMFEYVLSMIYSNTEWNTFKGAQI